MRDADLGHMMAVTCWKHKSLPALWVDGITISYDELFNRGSSIGSGIGTARRCAIFSTRSLWSFAGIVGALLAGAIYVPLNIRHPHDRLLSILTIAQVDAIVLDERSMPLARKLLEQVPQNMKVIVPQLPDWAATLPRHDFIRRSELNPRRSFFRSDAQRQEGAYLLFTSGSTGTPKGVLVSQKNVVAYLDNFTKRYAVTPTDRCTQLFDLTFDLSVHDMFVTWNAGATLYCPPESTLMAPYRFIKQHDITSWFSVPSTVAIMSRLRSLKANSFPSIKWSGFCGEALPRVLVMQWSAAAPNTIIDNLYGPTETTIAVTGYRLPSDPNEIAQLPDIIPIGQPFPDHEAMVMADHQVPVPYGEDGELYLSGPQVSIGYWQQPKLTAERFIGHNERWYRTGDRVRRDPKHGLIFLGRLDRQVKISGYRIELSEVEIILRRNAGNVLVAVIAPTDSTGLARNIIGFVAEDGLPTDEILAACRRDLPAYMVPAKIHRVTEWPLNSNGKTDYTQLQVMAGNDDGH